MNVKICRVGADRTDEWNRIAKESPHGTIFHSWDWLAIAARYSGCTLHPLIGYNKGEAVGIFPLFSMKRFGLNFVFSPPPHTALLYLGPALLSDIISMQSKKEKMYSSFQEGVNTYLEQELRPHYVQIYLAPNYSDPRFFAWSGYAVKPEYNYVSDLTEGPEELFQHLPKKRRNAIRQAQRRGMTVEMGGRKELEVIYHLMVERYREQGMAVQVPQDYLIEILETYPENLKIFVTYYEGEIVTGLIDIHYKDALLSWIGNPKPSKPISPSPNDLIQWEEIQYCSKMGITSYVQIGTAGNERLHSYYSTKFNPRLDVRFSAKKSSVFMGCIESAYTHAYKPALSHVKKSWKQ